MAAFSNRPRKRANFATSAHANLSTVCVPSSCAVSCALPIQQNQCSSAEDVVVAEWLSWLGLLSVLLLLYSLGLEWVSLRFMNYAFGRVFVQDSVFSISFADPHLVSSRKWALFQKAQVIPLVVHTLQALGAVALVPPDDLEAVNSQLKSHCIISSRETCVSDQWNVAFLLAFLSMTALSSSSEESLVSMQRSSTQRVVMCSVRKMKLKCAHYNLLVIITLLSRPQKIWKAAIKGSQPFLAFPSCQEQPNALNPNSL